MEYPKFLAVGNWIFIHLKADFFRQKDNPVGGPIPENLYYAYHSFKGIDLSADLRTYEGLVAYGCTEPSNEEILRLIKY